MAKVAPSILAADFNRLGEEIKAIEEAGADMIHLDIMDGHYVPNITFGMPIVAALRKITKLPLDAHLMISNPEKFVEEFAKSGADIITYHIEAGNDPKMLNQQIRATGKKVGVSVDAYTGVEKIMDILDEVDYVLVMSVKTGFSGQKFMPEAFEKIKTLVEERKGRKLKFKIMVDGGINEATGKKAVEAGAEILVAASYIFKSKDYKKAIESLKKL